MSDQIRWDCHMHSSFSADSETPMEEMIRKAIDCGLEGICFTEHLDPDYPEAPDHLDFFLDIPAYQTKLYALKKKYQDRLDIRFGIELGLQMHLEPDFHRLLQEVPFDFVIGSSHVVHHQDPYYGAFYEGRREEEAYREYFVSILENLRTDVDFDVYGHLDYVVRYGPNKNRDYSYEKYADILDEILRTLVAQGKGLELNTAGFKYGLGHPNPTEAILKRYRELGGEIITLGSDGHAPEHLAYAFERVPELLKQAGFSYYTVFTRRKPTFIRL